MLRTWWSRLREKKSLRSGPGLARRRSLTLRLEPLERRIVPSFSNPRTYSSGNTPADIVDASLRTNSTILDLVNTNLDDLNLTGNSTIGVYLGNGNGTFKNQHTYSVGVNPGAVVLGDFHNSGKLDALVANTALGGLPALGDLSLLQGNGDGTFRGQVRIGRNDGLVNPSDVVVGDFNSDGNLDFILSDAGNDDVLYYAGNGDGTFQPPVVIYQNTGAGPAGLAVADFAGNGQLDLAIGLYNNNQVVVLMGNGDGTFQDPQVYNTGLNPAAIAVADFNGDGAADMVITDNGDNTATELLNNNDGTGTFGAGTSIVVGARGDTSGFVAAGDVNNDGSADLVVTVPTLNLPIEKKVNYLLNNNDGSGTFRNFVTTDGGDTPAGLALGDYHQNGYLDIATTDAIALLPFDHIAILTNLRNWAPSSAAGDQGGMAVTTPITGHLPNTPTPISPVTHHPIPGYFRMYAPDLFAPTATESSVVALHTAPSSEQAPLTPTTTDNTAAAPVAPTVVDDTSAVPSPSGTQLLDHPLPAALSLFTPVHTEPSLAWNPDGTETTA